MSTETPRSTRSAVDVVLAWQAAANAKDTQTVLELSDDDIEVGGPRGAARGRLVLRDWLESTGIELRTLRVFARDATVVVEQTAAWTALHGTFTRAFIATLFVVKDERVCRAVRFDSLALALASAGLKEANQVPAPQAS